MDLALFGFALGSVYVGHMAAIRDDAERLREDRSVHRRTLFMLLTGPLMVLVVVVWSRSALYGRKERQEE